MAQAKRPPTRLLSASAIGFYGSCGDEILTETAAGAPSFLGKLCQDWERAAMGAEKSGIRVACMRIGIVLGNEGAALAKMLPLFKTGLGGPMGSGKQYVSWIHLSDLVEVFAVALTDDRYRGPINAVAPGAVTNAEFSTAIGRAVRRPSFLKAPGWAIRALLGESASVLLGGQRVTPSLLRHLGFEFGYPDIDTALDQIVRLPTTSVRIRRSREPSDRPEGAPPVQYVLEQQTSVRAPLAQVFQFFARAENLGAITPSWMNFEILDATPGDIRVGTEIRYRISLGPFPMRWVTEITVWKPGMRFVDNQARGPYRTWFHEHLFEEDGDSTIVTDRVAYTLPGWGLGRLVHRMLIGSTLRRIFAFRAQAISHRFGCAVTSLPAHLQTQETTSDAAE